VIDLEAALRSSSALVHDDLGSNISAHVHQSKGDYRAAAAKAHLVIKRRFASVGLACVTAVIYLYFWANDVRLMLQFIQWKELIPPATRFDLIIQF
jgi:hypothetical protein